MAYSFTEKKRIRKNFGKRPSILGTPYLLAIQLDSYRRFLQAEVPGIQTRRNRAARRLRQRVPDLQLFGQCDARVRELPAGRAGIRREGMPAARPDLRGAAARQGAPGGARQGGQRRQEAGQGRARAGGLPGRAAADDRERHLHHQRHRARHRLAAAPQPGRVLRSRPRQDPLLGQAAVLRAHHSLSRLVAGLRVRPEGLRVRAHRPAAQAAGDHHPARARLHRGADICDMFFEKNVFHLSKKDIEFEIIPQRLRGETASFEIRVGKKVIVEEGRRITARHVRELEEAGVKRLPVPTEYLQGKVLAHDIVNTETGEILAKANEILTVPTVGKAHRKRHHRDPHAVRQRSGPRSVHLGHAAHRSDQDAPRGAGGDLPHDASRRAADQGCRREPVPEPVLQRRALRPVAGGAHEVQPPRGPGGNHRLRRARARKTSSRS